VQKIDEDSAQLADALMSATPIIITTLQKFPFVTAKLANCRTGSTRSLLMRPQLAVRRGRHGAQGRARGREHQAEGQGGAEAQGLLDHEEEILKTIAKRGHQPNISFFAFTATPKYKTLKVFGDLAPTTKPVPFHLYSMRQAIEEGSSSTCSATTPPTEATTGS